MNYKNKVFHLLNPNLVTIKELNNALSKYEFPIEFVSPTEFNRFIQEDDNLNYLQNFITDLNNTRKVVSK